ncbi:DUF302 domain-containing protein [Legionella pneumophila serogroup 1]
MNNIKYGFGKKTLYSFDDAIKKVTEELQKEGFGVLTNIDVSATLKKKLNQDMPPYQILGACNLPCNVVVRQDNTGIVYIEFMDPQAVLELVSNPEINQIASEVRKRLERVLNAL